MPRPAAGAVRAVVHENTRPAGVRSGTTLSLKLDIVTAAWKPEGDDDPEVPIFAFAERGGSALVPGPLIRVPRGTELHVTLRNPGDSAFTVSGLRPGMASGTDTITLAARSTREVRYRLDQVGTHLYFAAFAGSGFEDRLWLDSQLNGVIVVDPPGRATMADHIFVLSEWFHPYDDGRPFEVVSLINGKGWPHTQRLDLMQGDSTRFRIVNALPLHHPMHLHGFYYRLESHGREGVDVPVPLGQQFLSNTDVVKPGSTTTLSFVANTPGNWLLHCHFAFHVDEAVTLSGSPKDSAAMHGPAHVGPREHGMRGLAVGIRVRPSPTYVEPSLENARTLRLFVQKEPGRLVTGAPAIGFALQRGDSAPPRTRVSLPGPVLELRRGQPVRIVVKNNLEEPTSIHWHGLEIESFPDGVPQWSGLGNRIYQQVAPNDSFVAAFIPPRSGTFPYHSHLDDRHQMSSGMYGALLVTDAPRDTLHDHVIIAGGGGPEVEKKIESPYALVNGRRTPRPLHLTVGETHRLRIVSIHPDWRIAFSMRTDSTVLRWRAIAKDGADLPVALATERPAYVEMGPGETADFEVIPRAPGRWRMEVKSVESGWYIPLDVIVERATARP
ncbi:MAG: multicopper oxidase domain-containing protein [Cytophagaceae bacterium]|nr:multicopper oxidase domain-containing protein [Gemmatimonadaceae bacterium]